MLDGATVEEIVPLIEALSPQEGARLVRWIVGAANVDSSAYQSIPPGPLEFSANEDPFAWDSAGWDTLA